MAHDLAIRFPARTMDLPTGTPQVGSDDSIVGASDALKYVMYRVEQVAVTNATVLLLGETGTGKELVARAIHQQSGRRNRSFVVVDSGALPATLIENELFGRERGAFTGADTPQAGRFERANGGTAFLDEIGELPFELQPKLLRVLQDGQIERLGGTRTARLDVRVIAATNRNLTEEVRRGRFRQDLFFRLNVFPITLPALRQRREDIPALVNHLVDRLGRRLGKRVERVTAGTLRAFEQHDWPGNVRELENVIQQAIILSQDGVIDLADFRGEPMEENRPAAATEVRTLLEVERDHVRLALDRVGWRIEGATGAARLLGLRPSTLRSRMRKLGIDRPTMPPNA
jgi:transcriptional regulator with GAF, ATPase, and Fis domain